ncbi:hypothetical protein [Sulfurimonas sp.]|uniref:hypothetical protein n=1 Tax=Sulfurimonas sp. TaxID=2022749 RepID=UPI0025F61A80|nr:hypothetical protein [Sulfurimonas sp.]MBW6488827.1 penicillin-binding protein activator [Sulfurimonas sp.]
MKRVLFLTLLLPIALFSQSFLISNIPLPKTAVLNLDPAPCDERCLKKYYDNGFIFSFLAHADYKLENSSLEKARVEYMSMFEIKSIFTETKLRIALLLPYKKIARYAATTTNASFAYLMSKNRPFELKSYKIEDESYEEISKALKRIKEDGFHFVIAPFTQSGEKVVSKINPQINIYFPTINKKDAQTNSGYLYYGGIDYRAQSDLLLNESVSPLVIFHDNSEIGEQLSKYQEYKFKQTKGSKVLNFSIPQQTTNLEAQLKDNTKIVEGSFFINTPIVKSGMIISQLTLYDTNATNVLSTQTNYNPLLLSMTQYQDRKNMIIANSITQNSDVLIETNSILANDIVYDWINYTTTVGIDYFSFIINGEKREYDIPNVNNQMMYPITLLQPSVSRFIPYSLATKE